MAAPEERPGAGRRILLVDHQDSFVHTLGNYLRQTGAEVVTWRYGFPPEELDSERPDLVVLSPGPGKPSDFDVAGTLRQLCEREIPVFGVCLGLQGLVEFCGGKLDLLATPMHGKPSRITHNDQGVFSGIENPLQAGRYHSLVATQVPDCLEVVAEFEGIVMGVKHRTLPIYGVQFHPESILTPAGGRVIENVLAIAAAARGCVVSGD